MWRGDVLGLPRQGRSRGRRSGRQQGQSCRDQHSPRHGCRTCSTRVSSCCHSRTHSGWAGSTLNHSRWCRDYRCVSSNWRVPLHLSSCLSKLQDVEDTLRIYLLQNQWLLSLDFLTFQTRVLPEASLFSSDIQGFFRQGMLMHFCDGRNQMEGQMWDQNVKWPSNSGN